MDYKKHIAGVFDRSAPNYGRLGTHYFDIFAERLVSKAKGFPGASILDVATGRGAVLKRALAHIGKDGKAVGIDLSPQMIAQTGQEVRANNVTLQCMDAEALEFEDNSFDLIYCGFALFFFPDVKKTMREFKRVLKPGGKIAISTWGKIGKTRRVLKEKIAGFGVDPTVTAFPMPSEEELKALFAGAQFSSIEVVADQLDHVYLNFDHWWNSLFHHGTRSSLEKLTKEQLSLLKEQLIQELDSVNRPDGFHEELNVFYTLASGV